MPKAAQITDALCACEFCLAGRAILTLRSARTNARYTFRVSKAEDKNLWFVSVLTGPDNTGDYTYVGIVEERFGGYSFRLTAKSKMTLESAPVRAFEFFTKRVLNANEIPAELEVYHEGRCGRCARALTVPESIVRGLGPECAGLIDRLAA